MHPLPVTLLLLLSALAGAENVTDFAPQTNLGCPADPLIRVFTPQNQSLHPQEAAYISQRSAGPVLDSWRTWLGNGSAIGYNLTELEPHLPKIGIGLSGGGYRAAQYGAGVLQALDARNSTAVQIGTGGMLQVASYLSGLSGGSWLTGSLYFNDWPTIPDMVFGNGVNHSGWILDLALATPGGDDIFSSSNQHFFGSLLWSVEAKANKSIYTSLTDPWARMISFHFLNGTTRDNFFTNNSAHGAGQLWSNIPNLPAFQQHAAPFPLVVANSRPVGSNLTTALAPEPIVYEITPLEFGSWDPNLSAMMNMTYVGTNLVNGKPPNGTACITGFDQAGFMMGTSASLFNQILDTARNKISGFSSSDGKALLQMLSRLLQSFRTRADDVANWPNPFQSIKPDTFEDSNSGWLELIDGSSNLENVPLGTLFVKARGLDVIVGVDASADDPTNAWPNGTSPIFSQQRITSLLNTSHQGFPPIPSSSAEFLSTGVNQRPTFFGCNPTQTPPEYPLFIYLPNSPPATGDAPVTNTGTFKLSYTQKFTTLFLSQAFQSASSGFNINATGPDPGFGKCLQCAAIDRARLKFTPSPPRSPICSDCFDQYCYDPKNPPSAGDIVGRKYGHVDPDPQGLSRVEGFLGKSKVPLIISFLVLALLIAAGVTFL
ncbi:phospholipase B [Rickenella mellea]|uniref:Lysophospholipase n=1 Tax=Rickenella mellea TaxID=50990 RepID=A0A4Y7QFK5_9AGAM|nr:phospholipase B [Rickenella mellea]